MQYKKSIEQAVHEFQRSNFGGGSNNRFGRFIGATLSKLKLPEAFHNAVAQWMKEPKNFFVFHGTPGIGKTHMCAAMTEWALTNFNTVRYHKEYDLLSKLRQAINDGSGDYFKVLQNLIDDEIVFLDDVGSGINPEQFQYKDLEWKREILFSFLDYRYNSGLPTVITSNFTKDQFSKIYSERICSRLFAKENLVIGIFDDSLDLRKQGF